MILRLKLYQTTRDQVRPFHRSLLRRLPLYILEQAYKKLNQGYSNYLVCLILGVNPDDMKGILKQVLEEVLWERGSRTITRKAPFGIT